MTDLKTYCADNQDIKQLMEIFTLNYIPVYNNNKVAMRNEVKPFMNRNFYYWYNTETSTGTSIAHFIDSHIYHAIRKDAVVFPTITPVYKRDRLIDINYTFNVYTINDHPFVRDMRAFLDVAHTVDYELDTDTPMRNVSEFAYANYSKLSELSVFTYNERDYLETLGDVCEKLALVYITDDKAELVYDQPAIERFFGLTGVEQLQRIVNAALERFIDGFDSFTFIDKQPDIDHVRSVLGTGLMLDDLVDSVFGDIAERLIEIAMTLDNNLSDLSADDLLIKIRSIYDDMFRDGHEMQLFVARCCFLFITVFGQYLQLIYPEYTGPFDFLKDDDEYLSYINPTGSSDLIEKKRLEEILYTKAPIGYGITALGATLFDIDLSDEDNQWDRLVDPEEYDELLFDFLNEDEYEDYDESGEFREMYELLSSLSVFDDE